jgi:hypothetical protein
MYLSIYIDHQPFDERIPFTSTTTSPVETNNLKKEENFIYACLFTLVLFMNSEGGWKLRSKIKITDIKFVC